MKISELISPALEGWDLKLDRSALSKLDTFAGILTQENAKTNLTAITSPEGIARRHILDSLSLFKCPAFGGERVIDIGSGAGFPAIPLAVAFPELKVTAVDSTEKKTAFLNHAARELRLENVRAVCGRAEELGRGELRESFDLAVSRAVARLNVLNELCLPFVRQGGAFIAIKAAGSGDEIAEGQTGARLLGGERVEYGDIPLPPVQGSRETLITRLVWVTKIFETPEEYPRRIGKIAKEPL